MSSFVSPSSSYYVNSPNVPSSIDKYKLWNRARVGGDPGLRPSLDLNFAGNKSLVDEISGQNLVTFSRGSTGTYVGADGLIKTATTNEARFDHNPLTGECLGLLVEEQRTNLLRQSIVTPDSGGAYTFWTANGGAIITPNNAVAPDGTMTAAKLYFPNGGQVSSVVRYEPTLANTSGLVESVWVKSTGGTVSIRFNYDNPRTFGPEWTRISASQSSAANYFFSIITSSELNPSYEFYVWGAQTELGSFPTSYIPTSGSTATRVADQVSITGSNFSRWYPSSGGSIYVSATPTNIIQDRTNIVAIGNSTLTNYSALISALPGSRGAQFRSRNSGTPQADIISVGSTVSKTSICANFSPSNFAIDSNSSGIAVTTSGIGTLATSDRVQIGILAANSGQYSGTVERIAVFPKTIPSTAVSLVASSTPAPAGIAANQLVLMVRMTSSGTYTLRTNNTGTYNYTVNWGDGTSTTHTTNNPTRTYSSAGVYRVVVTQNSGSFTFNNNNDATDGPRITAIVGVGSNFNWNGFNGDIRGFLKGCTSLVSIPFLNLSNPNTFIESWRDCSSLTSFPAINMSSATNISNAWNGCSGLTSFPLINLSSVTNASSAWSGCSSLTSFPAINMSSATTVESAWSNCSSLTSFPLINLSSATNLQFSWSGCSSLTSFPLINTSSSTSFRGTWQGCSSLTNFPSLNLSSSTNFDSTWKNCSSLTTFPANMFNTCVATFYGSAFANCALTAQSIENILVSINAANTSNGTLSLDSGSNANTSTWSATANSAYLALKARGWTITQNGTAPT